MGRLRNIYLIDCPEGVVSVPKVSLERPFRRFDSGDKIYQRKPSERFSPGNQRPEGFVLAMGFFLLKPSGRVFDLRNGRLPC